jgi:DNA-directed RNA polymerase subunit beta
MRELQSLGLDIAVHKLDIDQETGESKDMEVNLMADTSRRAPNRPTYESMNREELQEEEV